MIELLARVGEPAHSAIDGEFQPEAIEKRASQVRFASLRRTWQRRAGHRRPIGRERSFRS